MNQPLILQKQLTSVIEVQTGENRQSSQMEIDHSSLKMTDSSVCYSNMSNNQIKKNKYEPSQDKSKSGLNNPRLTSDIKSVFNKIDIASISVRKFNLDVCEEQNLQIPSHCLQGRTDEFVCQRDIKQELKRVCLPIFPQDILDRLNQLEINSSSASKSQSYFQYSNQKNKYSIDDCNEVDNI